MVAVIDYCACQGPGDLFVTLTVNDSWDVLKSILQQYENSSKIKHPGDVSEYFFKRFEAIYDILQSRKSCLVKLITGGINWKAKTEELSIFT